MRYSQPLHLGDQIGGYEPLLPIRVNFLDSC